MKIDMPPSTVKENSLEETKKEFSGWVDNYLKDFYENGTYESTNPRENPVYLKINSIAGNGQRITPLETSLTAAFAEKLISFSQNLIFDKNFNKKKVEDFFWNLKDSMFNGDPTILENLDSQFLQKTTILSEISEVYGLQDVVDPTLSTTYDLSFCSEETIEDLTEDVKSLKGSKKISTIKQLSNSAINAFGEGSWGYPAFKKIIRLIEEVREIEENPVIAFVLDFELGKIINYSNKFADFEDEDLSKESNNIYDKFKIENNVKNESDKFFRRNKTVPELKNVVYSKVSKDYGSIILPNNLIPIALVKYNEENRENKTEDFSLKEIEKLDTFLKELKSNKKKDDQYYVDNANIVCYLNNKNINVLDLVNSNSLESLSKKFNDLNKIQENINNNSSYVEQAISDENYEKTKIIFNYIDSDFDNIFIGEFEKLGKLWIDYKNENYSDGLFDVMKKIASRARIVDLIKVEELKSTEALISKLSVDDVEDQEKLQSLIKKRNDLESSISSITQSKEGQISAMMNNILNDLDKFHQENWNSEKQRINGSNEALNFDFDSKIVGIVYLSKQISVSKLKNILENIINDSNNIETETIPLKNYDGFTKDKKFNPLGNDDFSHLVKIFHSPEIRNYINNRLNINIEDLYLAEQIYFLKYLSNSNEDTFSRLENILNNKEKKDSINFLRSFLSLSGDTTMGDKIISLGENLPEGLAQKVFTKYGEIIDTADKAEEYLKGFIEGDDSNDRKVISEIKEQLLIRGKNLLTEFADKKIEDIDKALDAIKSSNEFFCAMLKSFKENKIKINLLELKGINREVNYAESMDASLGYENQQKQSNMINMVYENYKDTPELADKLTGELVDIFDGKGEHRTSFDMLKNNDEILAFCRYEEIGKNKLYFGSFNVKNNMRGLLVGDSFCKVTLEEKAKTNEINAVCNANSRIGAYYIENGFIAEKFTPDYYGIPILTIRRDDLHMSNEYKTKSMSLEDLKQLKDGNEKIEIYSAEKQEDLTDELEKVNHGYVLTRYFKDSEAKKWYLVLEKVNLSSQG